jgi:hypothetical protein
MSKQEIYFLDTINATKNYDTIIGAIDLNFNHSYNISFPLRNTLKNLKSIALKSVEMPISIPTIRFQNSTHKMGFTFTYSTYTNISISFNIAPGTYTNSSIITEINSKMASYLTPYAGLSIVFNTYSSTSFGTICSITHNCTSITLDNSPLNNYILGYTNKWNAVSSVSLQGSAPINVNGIDTCIYVHITNIPIMNNNNSQPFTFKLSLSSLTGTLIFNDSAEHQKIYFYDNSFVLDRLNIVVYDRLGFPLTGYHNWTMTLLVDYNNPKEQEYLQLEY